MRLEIILCRGLVVNLRLKLAAMTRHVSSLVPRMWLNQTIRVSSRRIVRACAACIEASVGLVTQFRSERLLATFLWKVLH